MSHESLGKPRHRWPWGKILLLGTLLIVASLVLSHAIWTSIERNRVVARVNAIRANGEPMDVKDYPATPVAAEQDIVPPLRAAIAALVREQAAEERLGDIEDSDSSALDIPISGEPLEIYRKVLADNRAALAAIAPVVSRNDADWGVTVTSPTLTSVMFPTQLNGTREVANLLDKEARVAHHDGDAATVVADLLALDAIGSNVHKSYGVVSALVGAGILGLEANTAQEVAPDLALDDPAVRARVVMLISRLMNDKLPRDMYERAFLDERFFDVDTIECTINGTLTAPGTASSGSGQSASLTFSRYVMKPVLYRGAWMTIDYVSEILRLTRSVADWKTFQSQRGRLDSIQLAAASNRLLAMGSFMMASLDRACETRYRITTGRHLAAVALAARLYAVDHGGDLPATLDALVPTYLPSVPLDAMDGQPLRYDAQRKIVWSVGQNGIDDGGDATGNRGNGAMHQWSWRDAVVRLERVPKPTTAPATQTEND